MQNCLGEMRVGDRVFKVTKCEEVQDRPTVRKDDVLSKRHLEKCYMNI